MASVEEAVEEDDGVLEEPVPDVEDTDLESAGGDAEAAAAAAAEAAAEDEAGEEPEAGGTEDEKEES
jgi:hypothetical protein